MTIEHADFDGVERLAKVLGAEIVSTFDNPEQVVIGKCKLIEEMRIGEDKVGRGIAWKSAGRGWKNLSFFEKNYFRVYFIMCIVYAFIGYYWILLRNLEGKKKRTTLYLAQSFSPQILTTNSHHKFSLLTPPPKGDPFLGVRQGRGLHHRAQGRLHARAGRGRALPARCPGEEGVWIEFRIESLCLFCVFSPSRIFLFLSYLRNLF